MSILSADAIERGLRAQGVPAALARAEALRQTGAQRPAAGQTIAAPALAPMVWPVQLLLPWSHLVSDNERHGVIEGRLILTSAYRRAKGLVRELARPTLHGLAPAAIPLAIEARVWVPDDTRAHDVCNFAKCVHDALEGIVYTKDRWLHDIHWIRAGVDVDAPRADVTIRPLL